MPSQSSSAAAGEPNPPAFRPTLTVIPSSDKTFTTFVHRLVDAGGIVEADQLGARLRQLFPRARVRVRQLDYEGHTWYVYRDGRWRTDDGPWWRRARVPKVELTLDGWVASASPGARSLLAFSADRPRHLTEFVAPGTADDARALFEIVAAGSPIDATVRLRPSTGDVIACELHGHRRGDRLVAWIRLASDIAPQRPEPAERPRLKAEPVEDLVFARYAETTLASLDEPSPVELAVRLRRLYPHARVVVQDHDWLVARDRERPPRSDGSWWEDPALPSVHYDEQGLILDANVAARRLLGPALVGRHWQELVTPGSADEVDRVLTMIRQFGSATSRFRMPAADGSLVEFDSWTVARGDEFTTVMRPLATIG